MRLSQLLRLVRSGKALAAEATGLASVPRPEAVTPSVGIAIYPKDGTDGETLLRNADAAMYVAKDRRPGTYSFFDAAMSRMTLSASERSPLTHCIPI